LAETTLARGNPAIRKDEGRRKKDEKATGAFSLFIIHPLILHP
jgi:hypothetical protein